MIDVLSQYVSYLMRAAEAPSILPVRIKLVRNLSSPIVTVLSGSRQYSLVIGMKIDRESPKPESVNGLDTSRMQRIITASRTIR